MGTNRCSVATTLLSQTCFQICSLCEQFRSARGPGVPGETRMRYKVNGNAEMTDTSLVRAHGVMPTPWCEPVCEHGRGIVGDIGERREPHPV
jgi:hypothetical protein